MANRPVPEVDVTPDLVRRLIEEQFPDLAGLELHDPARGWDNTNIRLGEHLMVRLPHRQAGADLILHEQRWLPELAPHIDLPIPVPIHAAKPSDTYPWHWSISRWFPGHEAAQSTLTDPVATAVELGRFLAQLHRRAPSEAPTNPYRGCPLRDRRSAFETNAAMVPDLAPWVRGVFDDACAAPDAVERVWLHGDLHTRNMIVHDGNLSAIVDWGDMCGGDPATDLAAAFMLVPEHVPTVAEHAGATGFAWRRARGWAAHFAVIYLAHSDDEPVMRSTGARLLEALRATVT